MTITGSCCDDRLRSVDAGATESLRQRLADEKGKDVDMFDRGDHYADLIASGQARAGRTAGATGT
ncbi:MAG: hypothetical protein U0S48_05730 [Solirubrobacteraceae bacterium]